MPIIDNPLESVVSELRNICNDRELLPSTTDAGSVRRILVHITNINYSVLASTQDHVNGAKRLSDFAFSLARIAKNSEPPNDGLTTRMQAISNSLRAASEELGRSNAIPNWRVPAQAHPL
jgi:hypothetical protein